MGLWTPLIGIYNHSHGIFADMLIPEKMSRSTLINSILMECGEMQIVYSEPDTLRFMIRVWSERNIIRWQRLVDTTLYDYNAIYNYDRTEEHVRKNNTYELNGMARNTKTDGSTSANGSTGEVREGTENVVADGVNSTTRTPNLTDKNEYGSREVYDITDIDNGGTKRFRSGYNAPTEIAVEREETNNKHVKTGNTGHEGADTLKRTGTEKTDGTAHVETDTKTASKMEGSTENTGTSKGNVQERVNDQRARNEYNTEIVRAYGNIGVTTTQKMLQEEREIVDYDVISVIVSDFKRQFCVLVY